MEWRRRTYGINTKQAISVWRKNNLPYGKQKIVQNDDTKTYEEVLEVTQKLKDAYRDEEQYWKQKSRTTWHSQGDRNTKFYHALTKQRRIQNKIIGLHIEEGNWVTSEPEVQGVAIDYFTQLFDMPSDFETFLSEVSETITAAQNNTLCAQAPEEEVRLVFFMKHPEKSPGPDGMTTLFFQQSWSIIKTDVTNLVNDFLWTGSFDEKLNITNIRLIPKTVRPSCMTELRPISLCNVWYNIISKVLCQRLKEILPSLISETQSAFVSGRLIRIISLSLRKFFIDLGLTILVRRSLWLLKQI